MKKNILIAGIVLVMVLVLGGIVFFWLRGKNASKKGTELLETPPSVSKVNTLPLEQRPYVTLIPHTASNSKCFQVKMGISQLKNSETSTEYELEYTTDKLIQGLFGTRNFSEQKEHDPLFFGTQSSGKEKCDTGINGGTLKLSFQGKEEYVLKGDFTVHVVTTDATKITSKDVRLTIDLGKEIKDKTGVILASTFGLPADLKDKVVLGPYGLFMQNSPTFNQPVSAVLQSKDVSTGKIQFWDGEKWEVLAPEIAEDKATFALKKTGVIVLTE